ncbi:MAG: PIN domain-containing protein [Paracoccaceae bacterium]|nr:PIN domain-containing protein [Paracoccaceae bacterium]
MSVEHFLDTNVFVYLFDETNDYKRGRAVRLVQESLANETGCISYQVVQETINVITRKLKATPERARQILEDTLIPLWRVNPTRTLYQRGLDLQTRYRFSFYDSLIVAAALEAGCHTLCSEDLKHGQQIEGLTITNPFKNTSSAIGKNGRKRRPRV